jgi:hypothetical protein
MELFRPSSFKEAREFAEYLSDSGMVPKAYIGKPAAIIATWQHSLELGVGLMQGLQGISNINGTPAVFGDLGWALVQNHPDFVDSIEELTETYAVCTLKRRGRSDKTRKYTLDMAKTAGLLNKDNWKNHPMRMLQWRSRSWAMRDQFPDSLKGMVIFEEAQDYPGETIEGQPSAPATEQKKAPEEEVIGTGKATEWYKEYWSHGWTSEESKEFLKTKLSIEPPKTSQHIPVSKWPEALAWAQSEAPIRKDAQVIMEHLGLTSEEKQTLWTKHSVKETRRNPNAWTDLMAEVKAEVERRDAAERGE